METAQLHAEDAYFRKTEARVLRIDGERGIVLDRTNFFAAGGGQPGDTGTLRRASGETVRIRLVTIGENASIDAQPCGGTRVRSTAEIGAVHIGKIEKKGKVNRRFRIRFGPLPG